MLTRSDILMIRSLSDRKGRREHGLFVVEGRKMVAEALASGFGIVRLLATADAAGEFPGAETVSPNEFGRISGLKSPQGVLALVRIPSYELPETGTGAEANTRCTGAGMILALDRVQDPGNLGTIIRTADWFGIRDVVCSADTADCFNPKVIQATMGSLFRVRVHYTGLEEYLSSARARGIPVYGAFMEGRNIYGPEPLKEGILVMGNEGNGVSPTVAKHIEHRISIPRYPADNDGAESLNVATATSLIVAEFRRRGL